MPSTQVYMCVFMYVCILCIFMSTFYVYSIKIDKSLLLLTVPIR